MHHTPLIVANWKMNPQKARDAHRVLSGILRSATAAKNVQIVVCPPTLFLPVLATTLRGRKAIALGVQDVSPEDAGAYTGQVSIPMVAPYRVMWAILGHSERRSIGETDAYVAHKVRHAIARGIAPIVCIGEHIRDDDGSHYTFVRAQLEAVLSSLKRKEVEKLTVAYEPVWAIGKNAEDAMQTAQLYEMALYIRKLIIERCGRTIASAVRILYGGAVKADNARMLMQNGGIDGLLVGSASVDPRQFGAIVRSVASVYAT